MNMTLQGAAERRIERVVEAVEAPVGTFTVRRALPDRSRHAIGPWVFLDHFGPFRVKPGVDGVGAHPHAGIETVTYLLSGRQEHRDSAGHMGIVGAGGAQWMTAGRGVVHAEKPQPEREEDYVLHGIQLWTTLPRAVKLSEPRYQNLEASRIPAVKVPGATVRVIGGDYDGSRGPAEMLMPLLLWHVSVEPGAMFRAPIPGDFEAAAYVISGQARFGREPAAIAEAGRLAIWEDREGEVSLDNPGTVPLELLVLAGAPAEGPLVFHGPFVMNSVEQVRAAEVAYRSGRMGSLDSSVA